MNSQIPQTYLYTRVQNNTRIWSCCHRGQLLASNQTTIDGPLSIYRKITQRFEANNIPVFDVDTERWIHFDIDLFYTYFREWHSTPIGSLPRIFPTKAKVKALRNFPGEF